MPNYRYRALTQNGEIVNGTLSAPTSAEVARRIEYLRLLPIETVEDKGARAASGGYGWFGRPSAAEITTFTRDLALLLKAGARLDAALELLSSDSDVGRLRPVVGKLRAALLSGESLADAVADHPTLVSADVWRAGARRRSLGHARSGARDAGRGAGAIRTDAPQAHRRDAIPGLRAGRRRRRHAVLHSVRAAAIFGGVAGFRLEVGYRARRLHQAVGLSAGQRHRRIAWLGRGRSPGSGGCCAGPARMPRS